MWIFYTVNEERRRADAENKQFLQHKKSEGETLSSSKETTNTWFEKRPFLGEEKFIWASSNKNETTRFDDEILSNSKEEVERVKRKPMKNTKLLEHCNDLNDLRTETFYKRKIRSF